MANAKGFSTTTWPAILAAMALATGTVRGQEVAPIHKPPPPPPASQADHSGPATASQSTDKLLQQLEQIEKDLQIEPGDQVVTLREVPLRIEAEVVGRVPKGKRLTVQHVQDEWLWVETEHGNGWLTQDDVLDARLWTWYQKLSDGDSVSSAQGTRARFEGVFFEIRQSGAGPTNPVDNPRQRTPNLIAYDRVWIYLIPQSADTYSLIVNFHPPRRITTGRPPEAFVAGFLFGTVSAGDYVQIDVPPHAVKVNGEERSSQGFHWHYFDRPTAHAHAQRHRPSSDEQEDPIARAEHLRSLYLPSNQARVRPPWRSWWPWLDQTELRRRSERGQVDPQQLQEQVWEADRKMKAWQEQLDRSRHLQEHNWLHQPPTLRPSWNSGFRSPRWTNPSWSQPSFRQPSYTPPPIRPSFTPTPIGRGF